MCSSERYIKQKGNSNNWKHKDTQDPDLRTQKFASKLAQDKA